MFGENGIKINLMKNKDYRQLLYDFVRNWDYAVRMMNEDGSESFFIDHYKITKHFDFGITVKSIKGCSEYRTVNDSGIASLYSELTGNP